MTIRVPPQPAQEPEPSRGRPWHQGPGDADCRWNLFSMYCRPVGQVIFANWLATTSAMSGKSLIHSSRRLVPESPRAVSEARINRKMMWGARCSGALSIQRLEGAALRTTWPPFITKHTRNSQTNNSTARNAAGTHHQKFSVSSVVNYFFIGVDVRPGTVPSNFRISPFRPTAQPWRASAKAIVLASTSFI
jgi:hypothetical protein